MTNKEAAPAFFKLVCDRKITEAYARFIAPDFIHHNQYFKGDRQSLHDAMVAAHTQFPDTRIEIKHVYESGDTVITHSRVKHRPDVEGVAVVHICRFENGKIAEMWDLGQEILKDSPNENGPF
jgi:predicted SnoaL-like aldol condensation-catalyzing enzyme